MTDDEILSWVREQAELAFLGEAVSHQIQTPREAFEHGAMLGAALVLTMIAEGRRRKQLVN